MKKILLIISFALIGVNVFAAKNKLVYDFLKGESSIMVDVDFSQGEYLGMSLDDFISYRSQEEGASYADQWKNTITKDLVSEMKEELGDKLKGLWVCSFNCKSKYTLKVVVNKVEKSGNMNVECSFVDREGNCVEKFLLSSIGGVFGSIENLMEDSFEDLGERLGKIITKAIPKK